MEFISQVNKQLTEGSPAYKNNAAACLFFCAKVQLQNVEYDKTKELASEYTALLSKSERQLVLHAQLIDAQLKRETLEKQGEGIIVETAQMITQCALTAEVDQTCPAIGSQPRA
jgi:hypothetical protein